MIASPTRLRFRDLHHIRCSIVGITDFGKA